MQSVGVSLVRFCKSKTLQKCRALGHVMFDRYLFFTNVGISMSLSALGDVIQQHYEIAKDDKKQWDRVRTYHMSVTGFTVGVLCHHTYRFLDMKLPGKTLGIVLKKVIIDQMVFSPMYIGLFFLTLTYLQHSSIKTVTNELTQKGWRLYFAEWMIWPPAQVFNFYILPPRYRVLYDNTISLGFDVYTSYIAHEIPCKEREEEEDSDDDTL